MARLIISAPDGKRGILELTKPLITIGRGNANDLVLNDPSVSRFHAVVKQSPQGAVLIADRGSTNGVMVNGTRITAEIELQKGDRARIGATSWCSSRWTMRHCRFAVPRFLQPSRTSYVADPPASP